MRIPLIEIEQFVEGPIRKRARSYFDEGRVHDCNELTSGAYEAVVSGTQDYIVTLTLSDGIIEDYSCECPYDLGPFCKHVVAVCFHLQEGEAGFRRKRSKTSSSPAPRKRRSIGEQIDALLEKTPPDRLKQFVRETAVRDRSFRELFLTSFAEGPASESKDFYKRRIKSTLRSLSDRHGFVNLSGAAKVCHEAVRLLIEARKRIEEKNYKVAVPMCIGVMEAMNDALQYADDSNGDIGSSLQFACNLLNEIAGSPLPDQDRKRLITYCFNAFDKEIYKGWDWHLDMLKLASMLIATEDELQLLLGRTGTADLSPYEEKAAGLITYDALLHLRGESEARKYVEQHIANPELRRVAIENALQSKDYSHARALANEGIENARQAKPGLVNEWYNWLLKIAQAKNDRQETIALARFLFIESPLRDQDYYQLMKDLVPATEWPTFREGLIADYTATAKWYTEGQVADIYIREGLWARLLELVKGTPRLESLERYEKYLKQDYSVELADLYSGAVIAKMEGAVGRPHYTAAARYIRRIKKLGCPEKAAETVAILRAKYPRRPALLEELEMV